jgi:hypothetical protein
LFAISDATVPAVTEYCRPDETAPAPAASWQPQPEIIPEPAGDEVEQDRRTAEIAISAAFTKPGLHEQAGLPFTADITLDSLTYVADAANFSWVSGGQDGCHASC